MFAYMAKAVKNKIFKSKDDVVSMFLGLVVVVAVVGFVVNFIEKRKGNIDIPGVSNDIKIEEVVKSENITKDGEYVVQKNDSLWKIAEKIYKDGYKWTEIAKENGIKNPSLIYSGQKLKLPKIETIAKDSTDGKGEITNDTEYTVVRGDSLWKIAVNVYGDGYKWTEIWKNNRNKLNSPDELEIGMVLVLYGKI